VQVLGFSLNIEFELSWLAIEEESRYSHTIMMLRA